MGKCQNDPSFDKVNQKLKDLLDAQQTGIIPKWENFKHEVKMYAIERSCTLRHDERKNERELPLSLELLLSIETTQPRTFTEAIREAKVQL